MFSVTFWVSVLVACVRLSSYATAQCPSLIPAYCNSDPNSCNGGQCVNGACKCPTNKIGETCQTNVAFQNLGNVIITQAGLDFAPIEYFGPINDAYESAKASSLQAASYNGPCTEVDGDSKKSFKVTIAALTPAMFTKSSLIPSSIKFDITNDGIRVSATGDYAISKAKLDLWGGAFCCPCSGSDCTDTLCPKVCSQSDQTDWIDFTFQATVRANIALAYSPAVQGIVATVYGVVLEFDDSSLGATLVCPTRPYQLISNTVKSAFEDIKSQIGPTLTPVLTQSLTTAANQVTARYQGVQAFPAAPGINLFYRVTNLTVTPAMSIALDLQGKVQYTFFYNSSESCHINVTYADTGSDAALLPPNKWSPLTKTLSPSRLYSPILAGSRMTRSFFNALVWAQFQDPAKRTRKFNATAANGLFAAASVTVSVPFFKIPNDAQQTRLRVVVNGQALFSCPPLHVNTVLGVNFTGLDASFTLAYDDTPPDPSIAFQVIPGLFDVGSVQNNVVSLDPAISSTTLLRSALVGGLNFNAPALNTFLLTKGNGVLKLPPDLQAAFPDAQLQIVSQSNAGSPAIPGESGYIEMINRCACSSSSTPLENQGIDGFVNICPQNFLSKPYCQVGALSARRRRRLLDGSNGDLHIASQGSQVELSEKHSPQLEERQLEVGSEEERDVSDHVLAELEDERRILSTPQQDADLTTVLGSLGQQCVTRAPTGMPTTARPTLDPTRRPTRLPTDFKGISSNRNVCEDGKNGCFYERDVFFFVCRDGYTEVTSCRFENSDIYCCPTGQQSSGIRVGSSMLATLISSLLMAFIAGLY